MKDHELVAVGPGREEHEVEPEEGPAVESQAGADGDARVGSASPTTVADVEALLFVAERPLSRTELRTVTQLGADEVDELLGDLEVELRERGIRLVSAGDQVMLGTAPESGQLIARYLGADAVRLSPAALETLAIVAYRQPVTRGVVERIRGVDCGHVIRGLLHRRLIHEQGRAGTPGRPILYATSMEFMERFGLTSLDDLPPLEAEVAARLAQAETDEAETDSEEADEAEAEPDPEAGEAYPLDDGDEADPDAADA